MSVLEYASQQFTLTSGDPLTIEALVSRARSSAPGLSLFHDEGYRRACLSAPERVEALAGSLDVPWSVAAGSTGLLDALAFGQLTVDAGRGVEEVVRLAAAAEVGVVLVVDGRARPLGVFLPRRYAELRSSRIAAAADGPGSAEGEVQGHIKEILRTSIVESYECARCGSVTHCPCTRSHPPAPCGLRKLT